MIYNRVKEEKILINGLEVNYKIAGEGQPSLNSKGIKGLSSKKRDTVLILHGWGGSSDSWIKVQRILANKGFKVIVPDFPGFGKSVPPPEPWGVKEYNDFILKLTEYFKLDNFFLLGHSFGGQVSVRFSAHYPEKLRKLILCAPAALRPKPGTKIRIIFWVARIGNAIFSPKHLIRFRDALRNIFYIFIRNRDYRKANGTMKETIKKVLKEDLMEELPKIQAKTLVIWGDRDKMVPVKYAHIFKENIKNTRLEILPKIGHSPHLEVPAKLSELIINFFK